MSESPPPVPEPAAPRKRRRWIVGLLLMVLVCGGAYWWQNRLTPDEQFLVGRWELIYTSRTGKVDKEMVECFPNRSAYSYPEWYRWSANHEQISVREVLPIHHVVLAWVRNGFKNWNEYGLERFQCETIGHDKIISHLESGWTLEWRRIAE